MLPISLYTRVGSFYQGFYKVVEDYNLEWAMASFDWSEGAEAEPREK